MKRLSTTIILSFFLLITAVSIDAAVTTYSNRAIYNVAVPLGSTSNIDFTTYDSGLNVLIPNGDVYIDPLNLRDATFAGQLYYSDKVYTFPNATYPVKLPKDTYAFGTDLFVFYGTPGTFTVTLSTGDVFSFSFTSQGQFFGAISDQPIEWATVHFNNDYHMMDNFTFTRTNADNCPTTHNPNQIDTDNDGIGDACDTDGLVSRWSFEQTPADGFDGNHGAAIGSTGYTFGYSSHSLALNGQSGGWVQVPGSPSLSLTGPFTLAAWVRLNQNNVQQAIIEKYDVPGLNGYYLRLNSAGRLEASVCGPSAPTYCNAISAGATVITTGKWHHVAAVYDASTIKVYLDGMLDGTVIATIAPTDGPMSLKIGARGDDANTRLNGRIDEAKIFSRALSSADVAGLADAVVDSDGDGILDEIDNCTTTGNPDQADSDGDGIGDACDSALSCSGIAPPAGMVGWWPGDGNAIDVIGGNNGTLNGDTTFTGGKVAQAFRFDGSGDAVAIGNPPALRLQTFTIDAWVKRTSPTTISFIGDGEIFGYGYGGYVLGIRNDGRVFLSKNGVGEVDSGALRVADTNFHHVAVTKGGSSVIFYIDGVATSPQNYDPGFTFASNAAIGAEGGLSGSFYGVIDELEIFSRALSGPEIFSLYTAGSAGKCKDADGDGLNDDIDNCPITPNPGQEDIDSDGIGDVCDPDDDNDGVSDSSDNCPVTSNANQADSDNDGTGDSCDPDDDNDGVLDGDDNCSLAANPDQSDTDSDGQGDVCDPDDDNDTVLDGSDNCPLTANTDQANNDGDALGDVCDSDDDNDGVADGSDNCPLTSNSSQTDTDGDGAGDACDPDDDGDGVIDTADNCALTANADQVDTDGDGLGNACDDDDDGDGDLDGADNCPLSPNPDQADNDGDGLGDVCDPDDDNDGVSDGTDNCQFTQNPDQADNDGDALGDVCDPDDDNDGVADGADNCPFAANSAQTDTDADGLGDACDSDDDADGVPDATDNCPLIVNEDQADLDNDGVGDACDPDDDGDGVPDGVDNCPRTPNTDQRDTDGDGVGDVCTPFAWPTGGHFVIGDLVSIAGGARVNFWGSQWSQNNPLSGGNAPPAFKGFENVSSLPACGGTWSTQPGNSSNPPANAPTSMAVIVSSSISKTGSVITGDVARIVIVETEPGYGPAPGQEGHGRVIAILCGAP